MKVSTKLFNQQQLKQFTSLNDEIQKTQKKISTGKNILLASDDPTGSVQLSGLQVIRDQINQYNKNIETSKKDLPYSIKTSKYEYYYDKSTRVNYTSVK